MVVIEEEIYQDLSIDEITILQTLFFRKFHLYKSIRSSVQQIILIVNESFVSWTNYENLKIESHYTSRYKSMQNNFHRFEYTFVFR